MFGREDKDLAMRRWQTVREHRRRGFRDDATITIDVDDSLLWLQRRYLSDKERLMLLICVRHGARAITVAELNRKVSEAVAEAGSMKAAIEKMQPPSIESRPAAYEAAHEGADDIGSIPPERLGSNVSRNGQDHTTE